MTLENMIQALEELKGWEGLPYCIEEPMGAEGVGVVTDDLIENLISLVEFVIKMKEEKRKLKTLLDSVAEWDKALEKIEL